MEAEDCRESSCCVILFRQWLEVSLSVVVQCVALLWQDELKKAEQQTKQEVKPVFFLSLAGVAADFRGSMLTWVYPVNKSSMCHKQWSILGFKKMICSAESILWDSSCPSYFMNDSMKRCYRCFREKLDQVITRDKNVKHCSKSNAWALQKTTAFLSTDLHGKKFDYYPQQKSVKLRLFFLSFLYI